MSLDRPISDALQFSRIGLASLALLTVAAPVFAQQTGDNVTTTPIKHVIVIIGENRSFDHVFATYVPKHGGVWNLLSEGVINADGTPGPNFSKAVQSASADQSPDTFLLSPAKTAFPNHFLPAPLVGGPQDSYIKGDSLTLAQQSENGLPDNYYQYLVSGGTGLASKIPDTRIKNVNGLPAGPFQLTNGAEFVYNSYAASPVHRFYQMWQQLDCSIEHSTYENPSGCDSALFPWVEVTVGAGANGTAQANELQRRFHRRRIHRHGLLQCPEWRCAVLQDSWPTTTR